MELYGIQSTRKSIEHETNTGSRRFKVGIDRVQDMENSIFSSCIFSVICKQTGKDQCNLQPVPGHEVGRLSQRPSLRMKKATSAT